MDFDYAYYMLREANKCKENPAMACSPSREAYKKQFAEAFNMNMTRILAFKSKPPTVVDPIPKEFFSPSVHQSKPAKPRRYIPQSSERTTDAPDLMDDFYLNLLDCGNGNVLAIALGSTVYLWDVSTSSTLELVHH